MEHPVQEPQPLFAVHRLGFHAKALEVVENVRFNTLQPGLCRFQVVRFNAKGEVFGFHQAVVTSGKLVLEHFRVLGADTVKGVAFCGDRNTPGGAFSVSRQIYKGKLESDRRIEVVEKIAPAVEDGHFILILIELVVDVLKLHRLGVVVVGYAADTVREHPLKGDAVLRRFLFLIRALCFCDCRVDLLFLGAGQLSC